MAEGDGLQDIVESAVEDARNAPRVPTNPSTPAPAPPAGGAPSGFFPGVGASPGTVVGTQSSGRFWPNEVRSYWGIPLAGPATEGGGLASQRAVGMAARDEKPLDRPATEYRPGAPLMHGDGITAQAILESLLRMPPKQRIILQSKLSAAGYLTGEYRSGAADDKTLSAMADLLGETAREALTKGEVISWQQYLGERLDAAEAGEAGAGGAAGAGASTVNLLTVESVRSSYSAQFRKMVGRDPTDSEVRQFVDDYNAEARANPQTRSVEIGEDGTQFVTTSGGVDPQGFADEQIQESDDFAEYQAVAYYMPALEAALGPIGGAGSGEAEL